MNIENILATAEALESLGFESPIAPYLALQASFNQANFSIQQRHTKDKNIITCILYFEKDNDKYSCLYFDAILRKEIIIADTTVNGIDCKEIDLRMQEVNWRSMFLFQGDKELSMKKSADWDNEEKIESIVSDITILESTDEGRDVAERLKVKYWCDTPVQDIIANLHILRAKFEISQRFYFFDGQSGIGVEEAYRFLNNRWLEKQMLINKKRTTLVDNHQILGNNKHEEEGSLLAKKRKKRSSSK